MTRARLLQTLAATFTALALAACGDADVEADDYAEAETAPVYSVAETRNEAVLGAVETRDYDDAEFDDDDDDDLDDRMDDQGDDVEIDDDEVSLELYDDVDVYTPYRK